MNWHEIRTAVGDLLADGDPTGLAEVARPRARRYHSRLHRLASRATPTRLRAESWDVLVILDGCRLDTFQAHNTIDGRLESRLSPGSQSWEFLRANFAGERFHDTVYVTANPFGTRLDGVFHEVVDLLDAWDEQTETVLPERVTREAISAADRFPNKRLVVHFMQPHYPFVGPRGRALDVRGYSRDRDPREREEPNVWELLRRGDDRVTRAGVTAAYRENLTVALPHVQRLVDELTGRTVVTADHGNFLGERLYPVPIREYGHPRGVFSPPLVRVPWLVVPSDERRSVSADPPRDHTTDPDLVDRRLAALGYRE